MRKGPVGRGKYYTQIHGDVKYNRGRIKEETILLLQNFEEEALRDYTSRNSSRHNEDSSLLEDISDYDTLLVL